jgi:hypothetical protein
MTKLPQNDYRIGIAVEAIAMNRQFREIRAHEEP